MDTTLEEKRPLLDVGKGRILLLFGLGLLLFGVWVGAMERTVFGSLLRAVMAQGIVIGAGCLAVDGIADFMANHRLREIPADPPKAVLCGAGLFILLSACLAGLFVPLVGVSVLAGAAVTAVAAVWLMIAGRWERPELRRVAAWTAIPCGAVSLVWTMVVLISGAFAPALAGLAAVGR